MLAIGDDHLCARYSNDSAACLGSNYYGQLGNGGTEASLVPKLVPGLAQVRTICAGYDHVCAMSKRGGVTCWGDCYYGQCGDGSTNGSYEYRTTPVAVVGVTNAVSITCGNQHTCALLADGTARCWWVGCGAAGGSGRRCTCCGCC